MTSSVFDTLLNDFLKQLEKAPHRAGVYNPYSPKYVESAIRQANLRLYLKHLFRLKPTLLLIGEAPGYRGCRLTGIPFSSEKLLMEHPHFGADKGYRLIHAEEKLTGEASASMVHRCLDELGITALCWNAFPFHPYPPRRPQKNRAPRKEEFKWGATYIRLLQEMFGGLAVVGVGRIADQCLSLIEVEHEKVRHPSYGGKNDFVEGLKRIVREQGARP